MEAESGERRKEGISHVVLVHGACHGAWCWYRVSDLLKKAGHLVTAVDLAGAGLNPKDSDAIRSFAQYNEPLVEITKTLPDGTEKKDKVILVGHSMGSLVPTLMMSNSRTKLLQLYSSLLICPSLVQPPFSWLIGQFYQRYQTWGGMEFKYGLDGEPSKPTSFKFGSNFRREYIYHKSLSQDITLAESLLRSAPALDKKVVYSSENYGRVPRAYIVAKQDKTIWEEFQRKMIANNPPDKVYELEDSDHSPFFSSPARLAQILQEISTAFY